MTTRLLSISPSELRKLSSKQILKAIALSEGRVLAAETVCISQPLLTDVTNAELAASLSADILILNIFDVDKPMIMGLPKCQPKDTIRKLKELTGRLIAINLEPVDLGAGEEEIWQMSKGRVANAANALKAKKMGVDMIVITGNPGNHVSNEGITKAIRQIRKKLGDDIILITGKMHASGSLTEAGTNIITKKDVEEFAQAGADIILFPAPGTVPGITMEYIRELVNYAHELGCLTLTAIGTSQEGSSKETIREIALMAKMTGTDIHHIGDSGYVGIALPENIMEYSMTIRGARHTYRKMAQSVNR